MRLRHIVLGGIVLSLLIGLAVYAAGSHTLFDNALAPSGVALKNVQPGLDGKAPFINVKAGAFLCAGSGSGDDAPCIQAALNAGSRTVIIPAGTYLIGSQLTLPANVSIRGEGYAVTILKKNFNGDLLDASGGASTISDLSLDGNAPTKTGRTVVITGGAAQWFERVEIKCLGNAGGYCVEYTANCAGTQSWISNSTIKVSTSLNVEVKYPDAVENGCPRMITNTQANGGILVDLAGSNDSYFVGNFTNGLVTSANTSLAYIGFNRFATNGVTTTISGTALTLIGNAFAGDVTLDASTQNITFHNIITGGTGTVTNSGTHNSIMVPGQIGGEIKIISGLNGDSAGFKTKRGTAGCATAGAAGDTCSTTVTWTTAFADANYTVTCIGAGITSGRPAIEGYDSKLAASVGVRVVAVTAAVAQLSGIECTAIHD